ncbi:MAG: autotransporter-associated beta strand repeat-containing protein [Verrucomicrobia bacterium]|nr:autotransporter-associated beta strand repeat-containing protein [Verrucomicrobiota bacterium]
MTGFGASNSNNTYTFANNSSAANNDLLVIGGSITSSNNGGHTTAITFTGTGNGSVSGIISGSGGGLSVTKSGSGTWILTGSNTYTGGTTVSAGTLLVDDTSGSGTGTGSVTVSGTGTLGGTGTISGPVTIQSGGTLNPGNSGAAGSAAAVGTLHTGALTLQSGSNSVFDVATPTNFDKVISSGALNLGGNLNVNIASGQTFTQGQTLTLFSGTSETGTFTGLANNQVVYYDGYGFTADYTNTGFSLVAIPEPSTWFAAALTLLALGYTQRRKLVPALKLFRR